MNLVGMAAAHTVLGAVMLPHKSDGYHKSAQIFHVCTSETCTGTFQRLRDSV